jgi:hypothetical protein
MISLPPSKILYIDNNTIYVQSGSRFYKTQDLGASWDCILRLPSKYPWLTWNALFNRLMRSGVNGFRVLSDKSFILTWNGRIYKITHDGKLKRAVVNAKKGSRPLFLEMDNNERLFWGEYFGNENRKEVNVLTSEDGGLSFETIYTFPSGVIRHIHGVFSDSYDNTIWITTGDDDEESGIWVTANCFRSLEKVIAGSQQVRSIQLLFTKKYVYFGSDTPLEKNYIYRVDKATQKIEKLQEVESSVFWGCKVGDALFFSTAVEPSKVSKCQDACIWGSMDGEKWTCIARLKKDIWPKKLFQYGQIFFPAGENNTEYLWFTPFSTEKHMTVQRLNVRDIF